MYDVRNYLCWFKAFSVFCWRQAWTSFQPPVCVSLTGQPTFNWTENLFDLCWPHVCNSNSVHWPHSCWLNDLRFQKGSKVQYQKCAVPKERCSTDSCILTFFPEVSVLMTPYDDRVELWCFDRQQEILQAAKRPRGQLPLLDRIVSERDYDFGDISDWPDDRCLVLPCSSSSLQMKEHYYLGSLAACKHFCLQILQQK